MANTYVALYYHLVFSTKNREPWIGQEIEDRVWAYIGGIARENDMQAIRVGGMTDHVHILASIPKTMAVSTALQLLKGGSSKWIHDEFPRLAKFAWQDGYGAFTVGTKQVEDVVAYIMNQRAHHRTKTFQEEYREMLHQHGVEFDERYVWG